MNVSILFCTIYYDLDNMYNSGNIIAVLWKNETHFNIKIKSKLVLNSSGTVQRTAS